MLKREKESGFLLVEAILGTILVAIAVGLMAYTTRVLESNTAQMKRHTGARMVARQEMERVLSLSYEDLDSADTAGVPTRVVVKRSIDTAQQITTYLTTVAISISPDEKTKSIEISTTDSDEEGAPVLLHSLRYRSPWS